MKKIILAFLSLLINFTVYASPLPVSNLLRSTFNHGEFFGYDNYRQACSVVINAYPQNRRLLDFGMGIKNGFGRFTSSYLLKDQYPQRGRNDCPQIINRHRDLLHVRNVPSRCQPNPRGVHPGEFVMLRRGALVQIIISNPRFPRPSTCNVMAFILQDNYPY